MIMVVVMTMMMIMMVVMMIDCPLVNRPPTQLIVIWLILFAVAIKDAFYNDNGSFHGYEKMRF